MFDLWNLHEGASSIYCLVCKTFIKVLVFCVCFQHFGGSTGYGHEEAGGREALDRAFAEIFGAESAIVRSQVHNNALLFCFFALIFLLLGFI